VTERDIEICRVEAPLPSALAWATESLLLRIFEYGDYSLRSALSGAYSESLTCTFLVARRQGQVVAATACLHSGRNPCVAVIGPVGVAAEYRRRGIGTRLVAGAVEYLRQEGVQAAYLSVPRKNPAADFYKKLGFKPYHGIVMRRLLCTGSDFDWSYFRGHNLMRIRPAVWGDMPGVSALAVFPGSMYTFNLCRGLFSSKYVKPERFLSVFPDMMALFTREGGLANVLVVGNSENVVGIAHIRRAAGKAQHHIAEIDFYLHDNFIERAEHLVRITLTQSASLAVKKVYCRCLACDVIKRTIIEALGARQIGVLAANVKINRQLEDVLIYQTAEHYL